MKIAIDTLFLSRRFRHTGTGIYLYNLLSECLRIAGREPSGIEFHGFSAPDDDWADNGFVSPFLRVHKTRALGRKRLWLFGGMAIHTARIRPDLVFQPSVLSSFPGPFFPLVSMVLDTIPSRLPRNFVESGFLAPYMTWIGAKFANRVITISEWSKRDLVDVHGLDPSRVNVTYLGYDKHCYNDTPADPEISATLLNRFGIRRPFILHHGMVQLRKNIHCLIRAYDRVMERNKNFNVQLVLAGPMGLGYDQILKVRETSPRRDQIILTGALPDAELAALVKNACLCAIPSLYEGFCLPLVEAMACGVPTVASNAACIPEISGFVLEYFDPHSVEDMAETIRRALEDSELRNRLRDKGLARAAEFSWERCARQTMRIFAETGAVS